MDAGNNEGGFSPLYKTKYVLWYVNTKHFNMIHIHYSVLNNELSFCLCSQWEKEGRKALWERCIWQFEIYDAGTTGRRAEVLNQGENYEE